MLLNEHSGIGASYGNKVIVVTLRIKEAGTIALEFVDR